MQNPIAASSESWADVADAMRSAGWIPAAEAAQSAGRSIAELCALIDEGAVEVVTVRSGRWSADGVPLMQNFARLAELEAAPRRPPLKAV